MRRVAVTCVLALAGCTTGPDGSSRPDPAIGSALSSFQRAFNAGTEAQKQNPPKPMTAPVFNDAATTPVTPTHRATFTGQANHVQTVTGAMAWQCQYDYAGQKFYILFDGYCPSSAAVR